MNIDRIIFAIAGTLILVGLSLGFWMSPYWLILPAFVGVNMFQAAFTRVCPLVYLLKWMGAKSGCAFE